jgi:hypothetical protein
VAFKLPPLIYGQTLDILVNTKEGVDGSMKATLKDAQGHNLHTASSTESNDDALYSALVRSTVISLISSADHKLSIGKSPEVYAAIQEDIRQVKTGFRARMHIMALEAIGQDLNGQITDAYNNPDWHQKWGRHYLLSLSRAHVLQQCTNFKDPGVQIYATQKFSLLRDQSEDIFCKLPPPTPSRPPMENYVLVNSMSRYYDRSTPCFARGKVQLVDGREIDMLEMQWNRLAAQRVSSAWSRRSAKMILSSP